MGGSGGVQLPCHLSVLPLFHSLSPSIIIILRQIGCCFPLGATGGGMEEKKREGVEMKICSSSWEASCPFLSLLLLLLLFLLPPLFPLFPQISLPIFHFVLFPFLLHFTLFLLHSFSHFFSKPSLYPSLIAFTSLHFISFFLPLPLFSFFSLLSSPSISCSPHIFCFCSTCLELFVFLFHFHLWIKWAVCTPMFVNVITQE